MTCKDAVASAITDQVKFFANVDHLAADAFVKEVKSKDAGGLSSRQGVLATKAALTLATAPYWKEIYDSSLALARSQLPLINFHVPERVDLGWPYFQEKLSTLSNNTSAITGVTEAAQPKLIVWDEATGHSKNTPEIRDIVVEKIDKISCGHDGAAVEQQRDTATPTMTVHRIVEVVLGENR